MVIHNQVLLRLGPLPDGSGGSACSCYGQLEQAACAVQQSAWISEGLSSYLRDHSALQQQQTTTGAMFQEPNLGQLAATDWIDTSHRVVIWNTGPIDATSGSLAGALKSINQEALRLSLCTGNTKYMVTCSLIFP